ncbi:hypothetical protein [Vibrio tapetis]|uniref:Uncharacterized protein n=1 Tax=Vibrio tapetis subsp. tapetis TaxID=1671868 RepID=A0A2N8ZMD6_9VIBR|nr:hypothetical protein [Vibrio tapetis]SON53091.1 conserved protein of unknown function [Vibrio tapetis subsp. tapetis]
MPTIVPSPFTEPNAKPDKEPEINTEPRAKPDKEPETNTEPNAKPEQEPKTTTEPSTNPKKEPELDNEPSSTLKQKKQDDWKWKPEPSFEETKLPIFSPNISAPKKLEHPLKNATSLTFMLGEDSYGHYLYGEGPIVKGAYSKFLKYVNHFKSNGIHLNRIMLHSPGGLVNEGLQIAYYIHDNNWTTDSDKYMRCYSSCGFIYAAGTTKRIQKGAEVGFHRPFFPSKPDTPEIIQQMYKEYQYFWQYIGGNKELYDIFMKNYGRDDMYILRTDNVNKFMNTETY